MHQISTVLLAIAVLLTGTAVPAQAGQDALLVNEEVFRARVIQVRDGDSLVVQDLEDVPLHLDGIDAPEFTQNFGPDARTYLSNLVMGRVVTVRLKSRAPGGLESVARVELNGSDLSLALIQNGMAWYCSRHTEDRTLAGAERAARDAKRGLWNMAERTPPWQHRGSARCWQDQKGG